MTPMPIPSPTRLILVATALALPVLALAPDIAAQQQQQQEQQVDPLRLDEVLVTVRKVDERAQDVPLSLVVYNSFRIAREGLRRTEDIARLTPGLTFDRGVFPNDTRPAMRGIQSERGRPSVAILVDEHDLSGANLAIPGGSGTLNLALHDLERIEVVKGPQSTLYGRNAFAGAVNYITLAPSFTPEARGSLEFGEYGRQEYVASFTGPVLEDRLAFRVNVAWLEQSGFFTNPVNRGALGAEEAKGAAVSLLYRPSPRWSVSARFQATDREESDRPTAFLASNTRLPLPGTELTRASFVGPIEATIADVQMGVDPQTGRPPAGLGMENRMATWKVEWEPGIGQVVYLGSHLDNQSRIRQDGDFTDFEVTEPFAFSVSGFQSLDYETRHLNHEVRWTHRNERFSWIAGVQRFTETSDLSNATQFWLRNPQSLLAGPPFFLNPTPLQTVANPSETRRDTRYLGIFAGMGWEMNDQLRFSVEARYNRDEADYWASGWRIEDTTLLGLTPRCDPAQPQGVRLSPTEVNACEQTAAHRSRQFTPRATVEYRWAENAMAYVAYARGFKPGGYETLEISTFDGRRFLPERLRTWEAGAKTDWLDGRLILNGAVYWNDYTDQQIGIQQINLETGFAGPRIVNAGRVDVRGFEVGSDLRTRRGVSLGVSYAYTDATFTDFVMGPAAPPEGTSPEAFRAVFEACGVPLGQTSSPIFRVEAGNECADFSGNVVGRSPRHAINTTAEYRRALTPGGLHGFGQVSSVYRSRRFTDESNLVWLPAYSLTDVQVGLQTSHWTLALFVNNVFDNDRVQTAQRNVDLGRPDGFAPGRGFNAYLPDPRRFGVRLEAMIW